VSLDAAVRVRRGSFDLDVVVSAAAGETVALVGPNGAGKTTVLDAIAGLVRLDGGRVTAAGHVLEDPAAGIRLAPERRPVAYVFQGLLLFPHLSVVENVAFGLRCRRVARAEARRRAGDWLARVELEWAADRRPGTLSGGEAQRVALARALAVEPHVLLLDEPLAAADVAARRALRREVRRHLDSFPGVRVLVTHDPVEAAALADRLVVIEDGRVAQEGTPEEVRAAPRTPFAAELAGLNLFRGRAAGATVRLASGTEVVTADPQEGDVFVVIRPEAVSLHLEAPGGSPRNVWAGVVRHLEAAGGRVRVDIEGPVPLVADVTAGAAADLALRPGSAVWTSVKATEITVQPV
jgi:molybdate transport system ATP-binding protein